MSEISYRVMKVDEYEDSITYQYACDCGSSKHNAMIEIEIDKELGLMFLNFYKDLAISAYWQDDGKWYKNLWLRMKYASRILFKGYIEVSEDLVIQGENHIDAFINALQEGKDKLNKVKGKEENGKG